MKDLFGLVARINGAQFARIVYSSDCKFPKKSGLGNVTKVVTANVQLNYDYEKVVKSRIANNGGDPSSFNGETLPWGTWEINNKVIINNGKRYLRYYGIANGVKDVTYYVDGVVATPTQKADILAYIATKDTKSAKQSACGLDEHQVVPRCVEFSNIILLHANGEIYDANEHTKGVA